MHRPPTFWPISLCRKFCIFVAGFAFLASVKRKLPGGQNQFGTLLAVAGVVGLQINFARDRDFLALFDVLGQAVRLLAPQRHLDPDWAGVFLEAIHGQTEAGNRLVVVCLA